MENSTVVEIESLEEAKRFNGKSFNIYQIMNDFDKKRRKDNLKSFKRMGFDIDYKI
jgi:hypothetical protein